MKRNRFNGLLSLLIPAMFSVSMLVSCSGGSDQPTGTTTDSVAVTETTETPQAETGNCLLGKWTHDDNGKTLVFVFNNDNTGTENIGDGEGDRHFSWKMKENLVVITYQNETNEWELTLNCDAGTLSVFGMPYTKE